MSRPSWSLLVAAAALAAFASSLGPVGDYDLWWHLAYGRDMVATGAFPRVDTFTYTLPGTPVTNFEGLSQLIFYLVYAGAGIPGLVLAKAGVLAAAMAFVVLAARARGASPLATGLAAGLALPMLLRRSLVRPEAFSYLCLALTAWLLALWLGGRRRARWALVPLVALWTNLHAGMVPLGLLLAALAALHEVVNAPAAERWRRLGEGALLGVLLAAACLASPLGLDVLTVLLRGATYDNTLQQNPDWMPFALDAFGFARPAPWYAAVLLVGLAAPLLARGWRRERLFDTLALMLFVLLAVRLRRAVSPLGLVGAPILATAITGVGERLAARWQGLARWAGPTLALGAALLAPWSTETSPRLAVRPGAYPTDAAAWIAANRPDGRLFHVYHFGGQFIWSLAPDYPVFIDGRDHIFQEAGISKLYYDMFADPALFEATIAKYGIGIVAWQNPGNVRDPRDPDALTRLMDPRRWALVFHGPVSTLYLRRTPANQSLVERFEYRLIQPRLAVTYIDGLRDPARNGPRLLAEIDRLLQASPDFAEAHLLRGRYEQVLAGRPDLARADYLRALALQPDRTDAAALLQSLEAPRR
jgi:hypothetical protein